MENNNSDQRTERILASLDGLQRSAAPDFFYSRLTGRMQREERPGKEKFILLKPAFITAALSLVLIINIFSLMKLGGQPGKKENRQANKPATIESFAEAYGMNNTASVYE